MTYIFSKSGWCSNFCCNIAKVLYILEFIFSINFIDNRSLGEDFTVSTRWEPRWAEFNSCFQRSIRNFVYVHDRKEPKECTLFCKVHWVLPNTIHTKGTTDQSMNLWIKKNWRNLLKLQHANSSLILINKTK